MILPPALKRWGPPRRQGLCSYLAHLWATCDSPPALQRWGPLRRQGLCSHVVHLWATSDFASRSEAVGTPEARCRWQIHFSTMAMLCFLTKEIPQKERSLNGQPIKEYRPIDGAAVAEWKATLRKIEEVTSITWEVFAAFLRIHRVTADGCTCANYCTFAMCEGVLLWLLVKEPNFKVPSQYSWGIVAQRHFNLGRVERKVTARAQPSKNVRNRQSEKLASQKKKALAKCRRKVVAGSDTDSDANVSTLALNAPGADESTSAIVAAPMEVHRRIWHWLNLFWPLYVCGQSRNGRAQR